VTFEPGVRRVELAEIDVGNEPELVDRIRVEIDTDGPITFARFMERALYEPGLGYYRRPASGPGRAGDFLTAPETHPIFGRMLARQLDELWHVLGEPDPFVVREYGAGTGTLAIDILRGLEAEASMLRRAVAYQPVEIADARLESFRERLADGGSADRIEPGDERAIVGCVLANEVLDALPVHRVVVRDGRLRELAVGLDGERFVEVEVDPSTPALGQRLGREGISLREGQRAEICLVVDQWIAGVAGGLARGLLLLIDYGYAAADLYGPARTVGTLMAYVGHRAHDDPLVNVGRQDLTAHVDWTAVGHAAERADLAKVGSTSQAEFLAGLGIGEALPAAQRDPSSTMESYLELRASVVRLLDPKATGGFRVVAFGRGLPDHVQLTGFSYRLPERGPRNAT
jgi:SAM-dependent MidA family methyltransferase